MKFCIITLLFIAFPLSFFAQMTKEEREAFAIEDKQDSIPRSVFLDSLLLPEMKVYRDKTRQVWSSTADSLKHFYSLYDIRLHFSTHDSALWYYREFMPVHSEYGTEIKDHSIMHDGISDFRVFKVKPALDLSAFANVPKMENYCILFVADKYFIKMFITCKKGVQLRSFQPLVTDVIKRIAK